MYLLITLPISLIPTPLPNANHHLVLCIYDSVFVLFCFLDPTHKWDYVVFIFLCLISLSIIHSRTTHAVANGKISFFLLLTGWLLLHCVHTWHLNNRRANLCITYSWPSVFMVYRFCLSFQRTSSLFHWSFLLFF